MSENEKNLNVIYGELLNRCWKDKSYLERFRKEPAAVLSEAGIPVKEGAEYHVMEQSQDKFFLILPQSYPAEKMEKLDEVKAAVKVNAGLGDDAVIEVLQNSDADVYLPYYPSPIFTPLSDEEVEAVAGGIYKDPDDPKSISMESAWTYEQDVVAVHAIVATEAVTLAWIVTAG